MSGSENESKGLNLLAAKRIIDRDMYNAIKAKDSFVLFVIYKDAIVKDADGNVLINIPDNPPKIHTSRERNVVEQEASELGFFRMAAGGVATILKTADGKRVAITVRKDADSPSYAGHDTIGAGLSADEKEIFYPSLTAIREGMEEIAILDKGNLIYPKFFGDSFGLSYDIRCIAEQNKLLYKMLKSCGFRAAPAKFLDFGIYGKKLTVKFQDQESVTTNVLVNIDEKRGGIDVLGAVEMEVESTLDELVIFDGEESNKKPFDRIINAWELDGNKPTGKIISSWQSGARIETQKPGPMVPHTRQLFDVLAKL